jgi:glycosyltransferase involved in cell wall biosynthesis
MIVRNEQAVLGRCLRSLAGLYDELCIVDTGSSDDTLSVARKFGARVRTETACNAPDGAIQDFSLARNACLGMASSDWVLSIDADEVLEAQAAPRLARALRRAQADGLKLTIAWGRLRWRALRLFRNDPGHRFVGRVHEVVSGVQRITDAAGVCLKHKPDKRGKEPSNARNLRLCQCEVRERPDSPRAHFYLGHELRAAGKLDEAIASYMRQLELGGGFHTERYYASHCIAACLFSKRQLDAAADAALCALRVDPRYAETHCLLGDVFLAAGEREIAQHWYQSALNCRPPAHSPLFVIPAAYGPYPRRRLRECRSELRRTAEARRA